jgi:seryl-tRNA synthetase
MLDIEFIRKNPNLVAEGAKKKGIDIDIEGFLKIDAEYRDLLTSVQRLQEKRNILSRERKIEEGRKIKQDLEEKETALREVEKKRKDWLLKIPNLPLPDVPVGEETEFEVIKVVGEPRKFDFKPHDHVEIGELLDVIDIKRAGKVAGTRFGYLKREGAVLEIALIQYAFERLLAKGFIPVFPPVLIKPEITEGLGYWQNEGSKNYYLVYDPKDNPEASGGFYLVGTAEHSIVPMHKDEIFDEGELPRRYVGFSTAFRREAGSWGKDTRGILRVHQFDKIEMVSFTKGENDEKELEFLISCAEELLSALSLPYRLVKLASKDLSFPAAKTVDIEVWIPSQNSYRETHSISTTTDFQARRLNISYKDKQGKKYAHILNGTAFAIGRMIIAILENYQCEDGSVDIPQVLQKYTGFSKIQPQFSKK